jgi:hypothetical protein
MRRLIGILGRLGSDADGERAAAGLLATQLLQRHGLSWGELLPIEFEPIVWASPKAARRAAYPEWYGGPPEPAHVTLPHQRLAMLLAHSGFEWSASEREFLGSLMQWRSAPTQKQAAWLNKLEKRARQQRADSGRVTV